MAYPSPNLLDSPPGAGFAHGAKVDLSSSASIAPPSENHIGVILCDDASDRKIIHAFFETVHPALPETSAYLPGQKQGPPVAIWVNCPYPECRERFNLCDRRNVVTYDYSIGGKTASSSALVGESDIFCPKCKKDFVWDNYDLYSTKPSRYEEKAKNAILFGSTFKGFQKPNYAKKSQSERLSSVAPTFETKFSYNIVYIPAPRSGKKEEFTRCVRLLVSLSESSSE